MAELPQGVTPERAWKATGKARGRYMGELERLVCQKWGEEGLEVIGQVWADGAERTFLQGLQSFGIQGNDAAAYARFFVTANTMLGYDMELVEVTPQRAVFRYHTCHVFPGADKVNETLCRRAHFKFEERACQLLNPRLKSTITKLQTAGDPYCEIVVEMT